MVLIKFDLEMGGDRASDEPNRFLFSGFEGSLIRSIRSDCFVDALDRLLNVGEASSGFDLDGPLSIVRLAR